MIYESTLDCDDNRIQVYDHIALARSAGSYPRVQRGCLGVGYGDALS